MDLYPGVVESTFSAFMLTLSPTTLVADVLGVKHQVIPKVPSWHPVLASKFWMVQVFPSVVFSEDFLDSNCESFVSYWTVILLFAFLSIPIWRWLRGQIKPQAGLFCDAQAVATLLSKARVNSNFSFTFPINLIIVFKKIYESISPGQCWRFNFVSGQFWDGFDCSDSGLAVTLPKAMRVP